MYETDNDASKMINIRLKNLNWTFRSELLLDLTCVLWLCNAPLRLVLMNLLRIVRLSGFTILFENILIFIPLVLYIVIERVIPWKYFHWLLLMLSSFFVITLKIHPEYEYWYSRDIFGVWYTVFRPDHGAIWAFLIVELSQKEERLWKNLNVYAVVLFLYNLYNLYQATIAGTWMAYNATGELAEKSYSLDFGYDMVFIALVALSQFQEKKTYKYIILATACFFLSITQGSRGALICLAVFLGLSMFNGKQSSSKKILYVFIFIVIVLVFYSYGLTLVQNAALFLMNHFHVSSRTLLQLTSANIASDSGRDGIYAIALDAIRKNPWGYGAYSDRVFIGPRYYWGYSHSIVYEMALNFGVIGATIVLITLLVKSLKLVFFEKNPVIVTIYTIFFSIDMRLIVSDTFWGNTFFWMSLAVLMMYREKGRLGE